MYAYMYSFITCLLVIYSTKHTVAVYVFTITTVMTNNDNNDNNDNDNKHMITAIIIIKLIKGY